MTHQQIQNEEIIEHYVRHQLPPEERRAFELHYFDCDECFQQAQTAAKFIASVRHSAKRGALAENSTETAGQSWRENWFRPMIVLGATATVLLAFALGWMIFKQRSDKHEETAIKQAPTAKPIIEKDRQTQQAEKIPDERPPSQNQDLAQNRPPTSAKIPTVLLDSARDIKTPNNQLTLPADAESARFVIEVASDSTFDSFQLQLLEPGNRPVTTIAGAKPNAQGTLVVKVAAQFLQSEKYQVRLFGVRGAQREMIAEYGLTVRKQ